MNSVLSARLEVFSFPKQKGKMSIDLSLNPLIPLKFQLKFHKNSALSHLGISRLCTRRRLSPICSQFDDSQRPTDQQQLNLSILRFTLGIPGLDESNLPRWIGYAFGSLLLLNHFLGSNSTTATPEQLRTEALGLSLAGFSIGLPYLGKFLKGAISLDQTTLPEGAEQIFAMSQNISDTLKEDLAWGTYILLRNTSTTSMLISIQGALCVRGYWNMPEDVSKAHALDWFEKQTKRIGLSDLKETLYFSQCADSELWEMLPKGTCSLLVQPVLQAPKKSDSQMAKTEGFIVMASTISYAYSNKDRAWIGAVANKFRG